MDTSPAGVQPAIKALTITVDECRVRWQTGAPLVVVDARRPDDWAASAVQIQHAHRLDPERLPAEFTAPKGRAILVYCHCRDEQTSARVAQWLRIRGYEAYALLGGIEAWMGGDGPVEPRGTNRAEDKGAWADDGELVPPKRERPKGALNLDEKIELLGQILPVDSEDVIEPELLIWAIGHARQCLAARGDDPEEDKWLTDRGLFFHVVKPLIAAFWSEATGDAAGAVPWDDGSLARAWLEWRYPSEEEPPTPIS